jgi:hypothetical protein
MESRNVVPFDKPRVTTGAKAIAIVIALTVIALVADHAYFVGPHGQAHAAATISPSEVPITVQVDGFALPENLRPTAADVSAPPASF